MARESRYASPHFSIAEKKKDVISRAGKCDLSAAGSGKSPRLLRGDSGFRQIRRDIKRSPDNDYITRVTRGGARRGEPRSRLGTSNASSRVAAIPTLRNNGPKDAVTLVRKNEDGPRRHPEECSSHGGDAINARTQLAGIAGFPRILGCGARHPLASPASRVMKLG